MKQLLFFWTALLISASVSAQAFDEVLRYSRLEFGATARNIGVGSSISALGADFSVLSTNPAGLAAFRRSELMFTPALKLTKVESTLSGPGNTSSGENEVNLLLDNIGYVMASQPIGSSWVAVNMGIGLNKIADFNRSFYYEGSSRGSIVDRFVEQANGFSRDDLYPFEEGLAAETEAIFDFDGDNIYSSDFAEAPDADIIRRQSVTTEGSINEFLFSLAGNIQHKLLIGVAFGVPLVNFSTSRTYSEENTPERIVPFFNQLSFTEDISTTGAGFNAKLGLIYRLNQTVRLGLAVHTPTFFRLTDEWDNSMVYNFTFPDDETGEVFNNPAQATGGGPFEYKVRSPFRAIGSMGFLIKKKGFITAEVGFLDYRHGKFDITVNSSDTESQLEERILNDRIDEFLTTALNARIGGELALDKYRIRAGYGIIGTSYADNSSFDQFYSAGLGIRERRFYLDLAWRHSRLEDIFVPYRMVDASREQNIVNETGINRIVVTVGFKFN